MSVSKGCEGTHSIRKSVQWGAIASGVRAHGVGSEFLATSMLEHCRAHPYSLADVITRWSSLQELRHLKVGIWARNYEQFVTDFMCTALSKLTHVHTIEIDVTNEENSQVEELRAMLQATFSSGMVELTTREVRYDDVRHPPVVIQWKSLSSYACS